MLEAGLSAVRLSPALTVSKAELNVGLDLFAEAVEAAAGGHV